MPPYQYGIDSSAIIELKDKYSKRIFSGLWLRFEEMCDDGRIVSVREVQRELQKGNDEFKEWADEHAAMFLEPIEEEAEIVNRVYKYYSPEYLNKFLTGLWADPLVIAQAIHNKITIIHEERLGPNKIPTVANH